MVARREHNGVLKMLKTRTMKLPIRIPAWIERGDDRFVSAEEATVADWRRAASPPEPVEESRLRTVRAMVRIAKALGLPDDTVLLPRLIAQSSGGNVKPFPPAR
jgi:hypothetical protein